MRVFVGTIHDGLIVIGDCLDEVTFAIRELKPSITPEEAEVWMHEIEEEPDHAGTD